MAKNISGSPPILFIIGHSTRPLEKFIADALKVRGLKITYPPDKAIPEEKK